MAFLGQGEFSSRESEGLLVCRGIVHGVIVGVPPDGSFPVLSVWSPSCRKRPGSGLLAGSLALAGCSNKGAKGGGTIPPVNSASAGSRSTSSSVASGGASAGASGAASADAVTADPLVDGATLAQAAWNAIKLLTPTVETNPKVGDRGTTLVGMDTWVWATPSIPRTVTATATAGPTTATASPSGWQLSAPDGRASCQGFGVVWHSGMAQGSSPCTISFSRSSAHPGGSIPLTVPVA